MFSVWYYSAYLSGERVVMIAFFCFVFVIFENEIIIVVMIACFMFNIISPIYRGERVGVYHS